jgi:hypothetical protein
MLALGCLLGIHPLAAQSGNRLAWAPSRDEAIVIDGVPANMLPAQTPISSSLQSQRPRNLSQPPATRARMYQTQAQGSAESLPSISGAPVSPEGLPVPPEMYYDEGQFPGGIVHEGHDPACGGCGLCGPKRCGWGGVGGCMWVPLCIFVPTPPLDGLEVFGGVQGYTGPVNRGGTSSFGFHEGFNWGVPLCCYLSGQWGAAWTQSNFDGTFLTTDNRNQVFFTAGLNRRVDWGFQGGLVFDYLHDEWDYSADLGQLRGELSWLWCDCNEIGFWFAVGINDSTNLLVRQPISTSGGAITTEVRHATIGANDLYAFFYRRQFACGGQGRLFAGFTGASQGLLGGDAQLPINPHWSLRSSFTAVTSGDDSGAENHLDRESWNVGISLVWTPCARAAGCGPYHRPLFNVADNGTFITRLIP